ncbi:hypothetical protein, partial [Leptospira levettii]|uniref:hypothetical protein n=1 Tax=Leptospira levettii TaxID=2023178 RepID=UPI001AEFB042
LALGTGGASLLQLSRAYGTFMLGGIHGFELVCFVHLVQIQDGIKKLGFVLGIPNTIKLSFI